MPQFAPILPQLCPQCQTGCKPREFWFFLICPHCPHRFTVLAAEQSKNFCIYAPFPIKKGLAALGFGAGFASISERGHKRSEIETESARVKRSKTHRN